MIDPDARSGTSSDPGYTKRQMTQRLLSPLLVQIRDEQGRLLNEWRIADSGDDGSSVASDIVREIAWIRKEAPRG